MLKRLLYRVGRSILPTLIGAYWMKYQAHPLVLALGPLLPALGKWLRELLGKAGKGEYGKYVPF